MYCHLFNYSPVWVRYLGCNQFFKVINNVANVRRRGGRTQVKVKEHEGVDLCHYIILGLNVNAQDYVLSTFDNWELTAGYNTSDSMLAGPLAGWRSALWVSRSYILLQGTKEVMVPPNSLSPEEHIKDFPSELNARGLQSQSAPQHIPQCSLKNLVTIVSEKAWGLSVPRVPLRTWVHSFYPSLSLRHSYQYKSFSSHSLWVLLFPSAIHGYTSLWTLTQILWNPYKLGSGSSTHPALALSNSFYFLYVNTWSSGESTIGLEIFSRVMWSHLLILFHLYQLGFEAGIE